VELQYIDATVAQVVQWPNVARTVGSPSFAGVYGSVNTNR
jgi:hypothetical protein